MFTYQFGANPTIDYPRMLIGDTVCDGHIFEDSEITAAYAIQQSVFQSSMFYSGTMGANLPSSPVSYLRVAALLCDCLASSRSRIVSSVTKLLDVTLDGAGVSMTAKGLRDQAARWREVDDESGAFVIVEQCGTSWGFMQRWKSEIQRGLLA